MKPQAMLVMNFRQLALIYEEMGDIADDDSYHVSERMMADELREECAALMGRDEEPSPPEYPCQDEDVSWDRYD